MEQGNVVDLNDRFSRSNLTLDLEPGSFDVILSVLEGSPVEVMVDVKAFGKVCQRHKHVLQCDPMSRSSAYGPRQLLATCACKPPSDGFQTCRYYVQFVLLKVQLPVALPQTSLYTTPDMSEKRLLTGSHSQRKLLCV
jgi:hypothetical protein